MPTIGNSPSGVVTFNDIRGLFTEYNTQLASPPKDAQDINSLICWKRSNVHADETIFPAPFFSNTPKQRNRYENRKHTAPEIVNFSCPTAEYSPDGEVIPRGTQLTDLYGIFESKLPTMIQQGLLEPEFRLAEMLGKGDQAVFGKHVYDNLPFFNGAKLCNPNRPGVGTFNNLRTGLALDRAGINTAFHALNTVKGPDGRLMRLAGRRTIIVSTEDQFDRACSEMNGSIIARAVGTAAAGISNALVGRADVVLFKDLAEYDGGKGWYVVQIASNEYRPFIFSEVAPPELYHEGLNPNEHSRVLRNVINFGYSYFFGHGYGWAQLAVKCVEP